MLPTSRDRLRDLTFLLLLYIYRAKKQVDRIRNASPTQGEKFKEEADKLEHLYTKAIHLLDKEEEERNGSEVGRGNSGGEQQRPNSNPTGDERDSD